MAAWIFLHYLQFKESLTTSFKGDEGTGGNNLWVYVNRAISISVKCQLALKLTEYS